MYRKNRKFYLIPEITNNASSRDTSYIRASSELLNGKWQEINTNGATYTEKLRTTSDECKLVNTYAKG